MFAPVPAIDIDGVVIPGFNLQHNHGFYALNKSRTDRLHFSTERAAIRHAAKMHADAKREADANRYRAFPDSLATA